MNAVKTYTYKELLGLIEDEISDCLLQQDMQPAMLYDPVKYILTIGGKRLRPVLMLMACNLFSESVTHALKPALGIEIFHNFTLLHDDIMDKSDTRRGKPTVHKKWNENTAILSGDAMSVMACQFITKCPAEVLVKVLSVFNTAALEVCEGQQFDMDFEMRDSVKTDDYLRMISLKTSALIAASIKIGGIIGGCTDEMAKDLYQFGMNMGIAFQLQDDYLDVFGDQEYFGKQTGNDIVSNKKTFLLIHAFKEAKGKMRTKLEDCLLLDYNNREEKIRGVMSVYHDLGIREITLNKINDYYRQARNYLEKITVENYRKEGFYNIIEKLISRNN